MAETPHVSCGHDLHAVPDLVTALNYSSKAGFDFICVPIVHPRFKREFIQPLTRPGAFTRTDLTLPSTDWNTLIVGKISPWIDLDSPDDATRKNSEKALHQEISYAIHLSLPAIQIPVKNFNCFNLARTINCLAINSHVQQFWIRIPMKSTLESYDIKLFEDRNENEIKTIDRKVKDPWEWWNMFRTLCKNNRKVALCIELSQTLPDEQELNRWRGEPIKSAIIPSNIFIPNKKGFPVLPRSHQAFIKSLFRLNVQLIFKGTNKYMDKGLSFYYQYLEHLYQTQPILDNVSQFAKGYEDYLQCPLQPLMDNLESQTYEVFEKDPVKYREYQRAVYLALLDRVPEDKKDSVTTVLMVVGAGRGPLVRVSLAASKEADRKIRVYAVEKNANAVVTLMTLKEEEWGDSVTVVSSDMREWKAPEKADILVSELLGSFGDNELSPECLDGAQSFLKDDGVSIPCKYTSFLAPLCSSKLHHEMMNCKDSTKGPEAHYETPYVVRLHNVNLLSDIQPCFVFEHPNREEPIDNSRFKTMDFPVEKSSLLHGFGGYFDTVLYGDVVLSIHPKTHSDGMFSWFPMYFPIKEPLYVPPNSTIRLHMWRMCSSKKVWYEWCITEPCTTAVHNPAGRSYIIGL